MIIYYSLGVVVLLSFVVLGYIFVLLKKDNPGDNEVKIESVHASSVIPQNFSSLMTNPPSDAVDAKESEYKKKIEELEDELRQVVEQHLAKDTEFIAKLEALTKENQGLRENQNKQDDGQAKQFALAQEQMQDLNAQNLALKAQLEDSAKKMVDLEAQVKVSQGQIEADLTQARHMIEQLKSERESFMANREMALNAAQLLTKEFEDIKLAHEALVLKEEAARLDNAKLKELADDLAARNKVLQVELSKYRAQASGLEKICENYKLQLAERGHV